MLFRILIFALFFAALGAGAVLLADHLRLWHPQLPDSPAVAEKVREVARLETLDVTLYKKVAFEPDPAPQTTAWGDLAQWVRYSVRPPHGKAIVFAHAHLGYDLERLGPGNLQRDNDSVRVVLPPVRCDVELLPGETEIVDSTLDSAQTAELLEKAKVAFQREALADPALHEKVQRSAEASIRALLLGLGFQRVEFGEASRG